MTERESSNHGWLVFCSILLVLCLSGLTKLTLSPKNLQRREISDTETIKNYDAAASLVDSRFEQFIENFLQIKSLNDSNLENQKSNTTTKFESKIGHRLIDKAGHEETEKHDQDVN